MAEYPALPLFTDAYLADTRHLTAAQHGAYLLLLMMAWRTSDCSIPNDDAILARWACMDKRTWANNREIILSFWHLCDDQKFRQGRLSDERKYVEHKRNINSANGTASALKRKERDATTVQRNVNENSTPTPTPSNTTVLTDNNLSNNKPMHQADIIAPKTKKSNFKPDDVSDQVWEDFVKHRKAKRSPVTDTVLARIRSECAKAGWTMDQALGEMCARGWQGFKAEWINQNLKGTQNATTNNGGLTRGQRADIALGIIPDPRSEQGVGGSTALSASPVVRQLPGLR